MKIEQRQWTRDAGWVSVVEKNIKEQAQLVFLFGCKDLLGSTNLLEETKAFYPNAKIVGCSTAGEILGVNVFDESVAVTAVFFENTSIKVVAKDIRDVGESFNVGKELAKELNGEGLTNVFVLSDGLNVNGSSLAKGLSIGISEEVIVTGGLAGDKDRFNETFVCFDGDCHKNKIVAVGFYGNKIKVGYGSMGGWDSFGQDRLVTRSKDNVLYELDGKPALKLYKEYLGDEAKGLPAAGLLFPLSLRSTDSSCGLVRTILAVNEEENSMVFAGDIPEGEYVRLMKANFERLIDGAIGASNMTVNTGGFQGADLAILISCVGRKLVLKQRIEEEIEGVQEVLGENTILTGFYSYGELCPATSSKRNCELHNQTMTITTFSEE